MGLFPRPYDPSEFGLPTGPYAVAYFVDPANGSDSNDGRNPTKPLLTLAAAYAKTTANQNDAVVLIGSPTGNNLATELDWSKSYTHLVGLSAPLAMGQRARVVNPSTADLDYVLKVSGSGCIIRNVQFYDGKDKAEDGLCVHVTGDRNYFENCFIAGMGDATALGPATRAGSCSLKVSGSENLFRNCTIGLDTIERTAASSECIVSGGRNRFEHCDFRTQALAAAAGFLVTVDNSAADLRDTIFEDCLFFNYTPNWAAGITEAINMPAGGNTHFVILRGANQLVGVGLTWSDVVTRVYTDQYAPNAGAGISTQPTS